ncbi:hypothetical protein [Oligoflexus tunisiensis]|uniref:hypothetical protein n=1 Tax=Oligoflexus tunisiensis TaxID=708132 RepID=UPI001FDF9FC9|nr:hypothetical protein [Oligoflexus tunisiensis]
MRRPRKGEREIFADWHWTYQAYITSESSSGLSAEDAVDFIANAGMPKISFGNSKTDLICITFPARSLMQTAPMD